MSHDIGAVRFEDGEIMYYEYDGTADLVIPILRRTMQEVHDNWRSGDWPNIPTGIKAEPCIIYSNYGGGFYWPGFANRDRMVIIKPLMPYEGETSLSMKDGKPDWLDWNYKFS